MSRLILVTGGARSGKSDFAQKLAEKLSETGDDIAFVATAEALDDDMARRIAAHRQARPAAWRTIESPQRLGEALRAVASARAIVVDCLTLLVSNVLMSLGDGPSAEDAAKAVDEELRLLLDAVKIIAGTVIVVTNEVGLGIVPDNRLARLFRDLLGRANAALAREADVVYLMVAGLPLEIKK